MESSKSRQEHVSKQDRVTHCPNDTPSSNNTTVWNVKGECCQQRRLGNVGPHTEAVHQNLGRDVGLEECALAAIFTWEVGLDYISALFDINFLIAKCNIHTRSKGQNYRVKDI